MSTLLTGHGWASKYKHLAKEISTWSKDPSTKVGAVVVGEHGQLLSQGYNGFPRGIKDSDERLNNRERKYELVVHRKNMFHEMERESSIKSIFTN